MDDNEEIDYATGQSNAGKFSTARRRLSAGASQMEKNYLGLLRFGLLIIATILLIVAAVYLGGGLFRQIGSTQVAPAPVVIAIADVAPPSAKSDENENTREAASAPEKLAQGIPKRTIDIYRKNFQSFQRSNESNPGDQKIVNAVWPKELQERIQNLDRSLLQTSKGTSLEETPAFQSELLNVLEGAFATDGLKRELNAYKSTAKVEVCNDEPRVRTREIPYWDSMSQSCYNWDTYPYGCASTRSVPDLGFEKVCKMVFPDNMEKPLEIMARSAENFVNSAESKISNAKNDAAEKKANLLAEKAKGRQGIVDSGKIFLAFLALMLLYIFVALERHYRAIRAGFGPPSEFPNN